jgi:excisionase family DNA binding protein
MLTVAQAAAMAQVSEPTVLRWIYGTLPGTPKLNAIRIGRSWRISRASFDRFLSSAEAA